MSALGCWIDDVDPDRSDYREQIRYETEPTLDLWGRPVSGLGLLRNAGCRDAGARSVRVGGHIVYECIRDLRSKLDDWIETFGDMGSTPEDPSEIAAEARNMHENHVARMATKNLPADVTDTAFIAWWEQHLLEDSP